MRMIKKFMSWKYDKNMYDKLCHDFYACTH